MPHIIHQVIPIQANNQRVYKALTHAPQFAEFTGAPAEIDHQPGGAFSCFDNMITGITLEVDTGTSLVQAWRVANWEPGLYSMVKMDLEKVDDDHTVLTLTQTGFPEEFYDHLEPGWHSKYWTPLKTFLEK